MNCRLFHKWSRWVKIEVEAHDKWGSYQTNRQVRECQRCGKLQSAGIL